MFLANIFADWQYRATSPLSDAISLASQNCEFSHPCRHHTATKYESGRLPGNRTMGTQAKSYGAVSVEHYQETAPLNNDGFEQLVHDRPTRRPLAWIVGVGAFFTLSALLFSQSSNLGSDNVSLLGSASRSPENQPLFYKDQLVDHFDENNDETWSNRYYKSKKYFKGAGHPIFMIVGGEGALDTGMLYPFVTEVLAKKFGAAVLEIEHRFYGPYVPVENATSDELLKLLTPAQALEDMVQLTKHVRDTEFTDCSPDRDSPNYCPIVTVGASYPGFLSFLLRIVHGDFVDISYASSAPLYMYVCCIVTCSADTVLSFHLLSNAVMLILHPYFSGMLGKMINIFIMIL